MLWFTHSVILCSCSIWSYFQYLAVWDNLLFIQWLNCSSNILFLLLLQPENYLLLFLVLFGINMKLRLFKLLEWLLFSWLLSMSLLLKLRNLKLKMLNNLNRFNSKMKRISPKLMSSIIIRLKPTLLNLNNKNDDVSILFICKLVFKTIDGIFYCL